MHLCWAEPVDSTVTFSRQRGVPSRPNLRGSEGSLQEALSLTFLPVQYCGIVGHKLPDRPLLYINQMVFLLFCPNSQKGLLELTPSQPW